MQDDEHSELQPTEQIEPQSKEMGASRVGLSFAYILLLSALLTGLPAILAYIIAWKIEHQAQQELWISTHARWIMRNSLIFLTILLCASLCLIPLNFMAWNANMMAKSFTVLAGILAFIAFLYLLNAWLKGVGKLILRKSVF